MKREPKVRKAKVKLKQKNTKADRSNEASKVPRLHYHGNGVSNRKKDRKKEREHRKHLVEEKLAATVYNA